MPGEIPIIEEARTSIARQRQAANQKAEADRQFGLVHHDLAEFLEADKRTRVAGWGGRVINTFLF